MFDAPSGNAGRDVAHFRWNQTRLRCVQERMKTFLATMITSLALLTAGLVPSAHAAPTPPASGDRIAITLVSDAEHNLAAGWTDSANHPRTQRNPRLVTFDAASGEWSQTLTYTARAALVDLAVYLQSAGGLAGCRITVNGRVVARERVSHAHAIARCVEAADAAAPHR
ncbi:hypothetical protein HH308_07390 [Gordonia sp. TBRC 11910]|uniref:Uncharacterized protein n=1 Tax=Gordonia asplenii TaxID=2725283 RepID=A0A848KSQ7_9ACTN|nr:MmpS family transport accessory protein [Gordonia asplenii]NMO01037.1 hypothetical protein [Gordonia asplenii]